jgi:transcriptional regulator with XRE-family HTH domain
MPFASASASISAATQAGTPLRFRRVVGSTGIGFPFHFLAAKEIWQLARYYYEVKLMSSANFSWPCEIPVSIESWQMTKTKKPQMSVEFWDWFDGIRRDRDLNDAKMAKLAGVNQSTISKARTGDRPIGAEALTKMADRLGYSRAFVLKLGGWIKDDETASIIDEELAQLWGKLGEGDKDEILALLKVKVKRAKQGESERAGR